MTPIATASGIPWPTILPIVAVVVAPLGAWLVARRQTPRKIAQSDAGRLWDERKQLSDGYRADAAEWRRRAEECEARVAQHEAQMAHLEAQMAHLRQEPRRTPPRSPHP